jgi:hypothetical protein
MNASKAFLVNNAGGGGGGGAFWDGPSGKVVINMDWILSDPDNQKFQNTGIILAPTPGVWSVYQWQFDGIRVRKNYSLRASLTTGFIVFSKIAGTPDARFGTGLNNPGFGGLGSKASGQFEESFSVPYSALNDPTSETRPGFGQGAPVPNCPIGILPTGEVVFSMNANTGEPMAVRAVLTISPEIIWPFDIYP